jgi:hypothetical protein
MGNEIKVKVGQKSDKKSDKLKQSEKAGPVKESEVEGQSGWILMACPWCGGMNRCWDTPELDVWSCGWCGNNFY